MHPVSNFPLDSSVSFPKKLKKKNTPMISGIWRRTLISTYHQATLSDIMNRKFSLMMKIVRRTARSPMITRAHFIGKHPRQVRSLVS